LVQCIDNSTDDASTQLEPWQLKVAAWRAARAPPGFTCSTLTSRISNISKPVQAAVPSQR
jgi:hypothetical protein